MRDKPSFCHAALASSFSTGTEENRPQPVSDILQKTLGFADYGSGGWVLKGFEWEHSWAGLGSQLDRAAETPAQGAEV